MAGHRGDVDRFDPIEAALRLEQLKQGIGAWTIQAAAAPFASVEHLHAEGMMRGLLDDALELRAALNRERTP